MKKNILLLIILALAIQPGHAQHLSDAGGKGASPVAGQLKNFLRKYRSAKEDVTIVLLDGSISTDMGYASKRPDAAYRPPCCTEFNIPSFIEQKLRWPQQQFRRYDAHEQGIDTPIFTEQGMAVTQQFDSAWDWQNKPPVSNGYNGLTRVLSGNAPAVSYIFPGKARRCDFIYRTDYLSSAALEVTAPGANVEVYDDSSASWRKANGYVFSAREADELIPGSFFPGKPFGATSLRKTIYQKRLKFRCLSAHADTRISISSRDGGRLCYWGIVFSTGTSLLQFINSARGGHDIAHLSSFEPWSVDYWKPDLVLYSCNTINEGADASAANTTNSPVAFAGRFESFIRHLRAKSYQPDVFAYILFTAKAHGIVDDKGVIGKTRIKDYGSASVFDFISQLFARLQALPIASANAFDHYWKTARRNARLQHTSIAAQMFGEDGAKGKAFTGDLTHLNDHGALTGWSYLSRYFNF